MDRTPAVQLTETEAIALAESQWWKDKDAIVIAVFQLSQERLCVDFSDFHKAVESALGRSVWTHEFAYPDLLWDELHEKRVPPTFNDILNMLPIDKVIIIERENDGKKVE